ncbi:MAG TPA: beta-ketoacyl-[acyl-carrier-protein] synthase family protein [Rudaea sp.]|uniref:beta-ketoacyl-[acyl-carrier-protein] synthase family protein n=1 Tax=Rudaea sp. TaxID=2136325 RepID=UPI002F9322EB
MPARIQPLAITAFTATCAAGRGTQALARALTTGKSGLVQNSFTRQALACWIGRVAGLEDGALPAGLDEWDSRNHRLAWLGLNQDGFREQALALRERYGAARVALVLGTSTSSIGETERAYRELAQGHFSAAQRRSKVHEPHALGAFVQTVLGLRGPCLTLATACSSSAKVFASAERLLRAGIIDAAIVGGVDTLCDSVLFGFNALELVSPEPCRPFDAQRSGLSLGEAAGFAILERTDGQKSSPQLIGYGESSDAHHMSAPHPQGLGAQRALDDALARAGVTADQVDYINLHGTASRQNDAVEAALIAARFPARTRASSTKGWTGHTLGAAGIVEAVITLLALERGLLPGTLNARELDAVCGPQIVLDNIAIEDPERDLRIALSNSFGFGGNNCCLAFARAAAA